MENLINIQIRSLEKPDLPEAYRIFRVAFGTFLGLPEPEAFAGDSDPVRTRWRADPSASLGAFVDNELVGFAICHIGPGFEAGSNIAYLKFAAAKPGPMAPARLNRLLEACESFAASRGLHQLVAGVNTAREAAYRCLIQQGFRAVMNGVTMHRGVDAGYSRPDCFVLDDWR